MASDLPNATTYAAMIAANSDLRAKVWSARVLMDARSKNCLREMIGGEKSGKPIIEKRDISKGGSDTVIFTTTAPVRTQGKLGENELKSATSKLRWGTFSVVVDLLRHAVAFTQVIKLLRFNGQSIDELSSEVMADWLSRKEEDDFQRVLLYTARLVSTKNMMFVNNRTGLATLQTADTIVTTTLEESKGLLISQGAKELAIDKDVSGAQIPKYMFFAPDNFLRPLRTSTSYAQALREADSRGADNRLFNGKYALWDNMVVYPHNIVIDSAVGRQGSPLAPRAYLGTALSGAGTTTITGGGTYAPADTEGDFFANFPGYAWKIYDGQSLTADSGTHYAMIYNLEGADKDKYEVFSYTTGNNGNTITSVTRGTNSNFNGNVLAHNGGSNSRFTNDHPSGSLIIPCTINGVPIGYGVAMGAEALFYAKGADDAEPIEHWDDFKKVRGGQPHLKAVGLQSVRGIEPYRDTAGRYPNFIVVCGALKIPGVNPVAFTG